MVLIFCRGLLQIELEFANFMGARKFIPLFSVDFSAVPYCFMYINHSKLLRLKSLQLVSVNSEEIMSDSEEIMSDSEEDEPCVTTLIDFSKSRIGSTVVEIDNFGNKVILHPSVIITKLTGRTAH